MHNTDSFITHKLQILSSAVIKPQMVYTGLSIKIREKPIFTELLTRYRKNCNYVGIFLGKLR